MWVESANGNILANAENIAWVAIYEEYRAGVGTGGQAGNVCVVRAYFSADPSIQINLFESVDKSACETYLSSLKSLLNTRATGIKK